MLRRVSKYGRKLNFLPFDFETESIPETAAFKLELLNLLCWRDNSRMVWVIASLRGGVTRVWELRADANERIWDLFLGTIADQLTKGQTNEPEKT